MEKVCSWTYGKLFADCITIGLYLLPFCINWGIFVFLSLQIVPHVVSLVHSLRSDGLPSSTAFLVQLTELIHCMMYHYSGFPDLYEPILEAIKVWYSCNSICGCAAHDVIDGCLIDDNQLLSFLPHGNTLFIWKILLKSGFIKDNLTLVSLLVFIPV